MFDRKSDYAVNKKDPDTIVFKTATGNFIRLSRENFTSEEEFQKWKSWSDEDYRLSDNERQVYIRHTLELEKVPREVTSPSPEQLLMERFDHLDRERFCQLLLEGIDRCLTETQRRRLLKFYFEGKTQVEIADAENVAQQNIAESIWRAKERLKKFIKKAMQ